MSVSIFYDSDTIHWVKTLGYFGVAAIIFAETGFFFCFFLPGDSLLFSVGMLGAAHIFNLYYMIPLLIVAAFLGYMLGYYIGFYYGKRLSRGRDRWYYKKSYAKNAHRFMKRYGKMSLSLGRMIAVIRGFLPVVAGMGSMPIRTYMLFNFLGAVLWCVTMPLLGFYLGRLIPNVTEYLLFAVFLIIILSFVPGIMDWCRRRK